MDIVEQLREKEPSFFMDMEQANALVLCHKAADEIERLRWENANMEKLWGKSEGTWMEIRDKQDAEIERLRDSLERIACFCQEQCKMNCAGWIASSALKEKE